MTKYTNQTGIVLRGGTSTGEVFDGCEDVLIVGRTYDGSGSLPNSYGLSIKNCKNVRVLDCDFTDFGRGIVSSLTTGFNYSANRFARQKIDGINLAQCWHGVVSDNDFKDPNTGEAHPDAIQMWSRPDRPPTSDIVIARNRVLGMLTDGITAFNHVRLQPKGFKLWTGEVLTEARMVDDGGYDRITIVDNDVECGMPPAIACNAARGLILRDNHVRTYADAKWRASITVVGGSYAVPRTGNTVAAGAGHGSADDQFQTPQP